jgi:DHA2 family multidrug resistance protein
MPDVAANLSLSSPTGQAMLDQLVTQQAAVIAYANDFKLLTYLTLVVLPLVFVIGSSARVPQGSDEPAMAMD